VDRQLFQIRNFIDGRFVEPTSGKYLDNIEPATGKPYSQVADSGKEDVDLAVAAAEKAFVEGGGSLFKWREDRALEDELFLSLSDAAVFKLIERAEELHGSELIDAHISSESLGRLQGGLDADQAVHFGESRAQQEE